MVRLFNAVVHFFRVRTASFVPVGGWLIFVLKKLPATVAGFFLFIYIYGPAYQRYRGTFVASRAWYRTFGRRRRWRLTLYPAHPRRRRWSPRPHGLTVSPVRPTWEFRPRRDDPELFDSETYSLDSAFPVALHEPFQEYGYERFDGQQDLDTDQDEEPHRDDDYLWGTHEPVFGLEETSASECDRFVRLESRAAFDREEYYLLDEQVDTFRTRPRRPGTLARLVTPGDGPAEEDEEETDYGVTELTGLIDWYHYQTVPTRISDLPPLGGDFSYLFYEHKLSYRPDPTGRPRGWYRGGRGLVPWLYQTRRARWGRTRWRIQRYYRLAYRRVRSGPWQTRRRRRHLALPVRWLNVRWNRPGYVPGNYALDLFGGPPSRRGLVRRVTRFAGRARRFAAGVVWRRRRRPVGVPEVHLSGRPRRDPLPRDPFRGTSARPTGWDGRGRPRIASWHAPRYVPAYDRLRTTQQGLPGGFRGTPPTGAALVGALFGGYLAVHFVTLAVVTYVCYVLRLDDLPYHLIDVWGFYEDPPWRPDLFRRPLEGLLDSLEVRREPTPRERVTTKAYSLWTTPIGRDWRDNPGVDPGLLGSRFADSMRVILGYETWWFTALNEQMMIFNKRIGVDRRGIFLWHAGWRQPSWVHMDDRIGDEWVHDPMFRLYHGELEPFTYRRELDHRYHRYAALGWKINEQFEENELDDNMDELLNRLWHYYRGLGVHQFLALPEWIPRDGSRRFHLDYAGYWALMMHQAAWPSAAHLDLWSTVFNLGLSETYDRIHRAAVLTSDGHQWFDLVGRWDPHLNAALVNGWDRPPEFPFRELGWSPTRTVGFVDGWVRFLFQEVPSVTAELARTWFYGGALTWWFVFRAVHLQSLTSPGDLGLRPVSRFARGGRPPRGRPGGWSLPRAPRVGRDSPGWARVSPSRLSWRWNRETYWGGFRRGRDTEFFRPRRKPYRSVFSVPPPITARPARPARPAPVAGLLYQSARVGVGVGRPPRATPRGVAPPGPAGWLVRPVRRVVAPVEEVSAERPRLFRRGRPRRDRRVHPDGTQPDRHRRRRPGWADPVRRVRGSAETFVPWTYRGHATARTVQHAWHFRRYRETIAGVSFVSFSAPTSGVTRLARAGLAGVDYPGRTAHFVEPTLDNGYDSAGVNDEENDDYILPGHNHQDDIEELDELSDADEEHEGVRYLSPVGDPAVVASGWGDHHLRRRLVSYHRFGTLPAGSYEFAALADYFDHHTATQWSPAAADHPAWRVLLLEPYAVAAWGRRLARGVRPAGWARPDRRRRRRRRRRPGRVELLWPTGWDPLWDELTLSGWSVCEVDDPNDYLFDDLDVVEFGGIPHEGYRPAAAAAYAAARVRPAAAASLGHSGWAPAAGWNTWRYLAGEHLGSFRPDDPEGYLLERLTRTYLDQFDEFIFGADLEQFVERDYDDLHEGGPFEEDNQEVPRTRSLDYPAWLVAAAVAGASAGDTSEPGRATRLADGDAVAEAQVVVHRPGRAELRRYYRKWRTATARARSAGVRLDRPAPGELQTLVDETGLLEPTPAGSDEIDAVAAATAEPIEGDDWTEENLRMWALTELYWGDLPQGSANAH